MHFPIVRLESPPIYFMHIPKTGGSSLRNLLVAAYPQQAVGRIYTQALHNVTPAALAKLRCISSHFGLGLLPWLPQPGLACITMLRDPVEQFVSHLYYRQFELNQQPQRFQPAYFEQMRPLLQADLRTLIETPLPLIPDNPQMRCLGAVQDLRPYFQDREQGATTPVLSGLPFAFSMDMDRGQLAASAQQQLETMALVGITEEFAESARLLCNLLGIPLPTHLPRRNLGVQKHTVAVHSYRQQLTPDLVEQVKAKTQADQALYTQACALFAEQQARQNAQPQRRYSIAPRLRGKVRMWRPKLQQIT